MSAPIKSSKKTKDRNQKQNVLERKIKELEEENKLLKENFFGAVKGDTVSVPKKLKPVFDIAQKTVGDYFKKLKTDPTQGTIDIDDQRYVLVRASALSYDFLNTIKNLYADRGEKNAFLIGKNFLYDIAHVIGMNDAKNFHNTMGLTDPIAKLSAGPVHFAYSGWAFVDILPESNPSPDESYFLKYHHPFSFEADSWMKAGKKSKFSVCIMNSGYSSGWCEESFGIPLTAVEITCKAKGDDNCTFIMAPPHKIEKHIKQYVEESPSCVKNKIVYDIPTFFERKKVEETLRASEERYHAIYDYANIGISQVSLDGKFINVNQQFCKIMGYSEEELYKMKFEELTHPDDLKKSIKLKSTLLKEKHSNNSIEKKYVHKNGSIIFANLTVSLVRDQNGDPDYFVSVTEDITEKKKAEEQLKRSLREKEVLLKEIHHRVKNNLQIISSMLSLQAVSIKDKNAVNVLKDSQNRVKSLAQIYESLYQAKDLAHINFSEYIFDLSTELIHSYQISDRLVELKHDVEKVFLNLDLAISCGLIVNELVSNSLKYAFPGNKKGILHIGLEKENGLIKLTIGDDGIGLPDDLDFRNSETLGLQLVILLVKQIKGTIDVNLNGGTKYTITFKETI